MVVFQILFISETSKCSAIFWKGPTPIRLFLAYSFLIAERNDGRLRHDLI